MPRTETELRTALDVAPDPAALARLREFAADLATAPTPVAQPRRPLVPLLAAAGVVLLVALGSAALYLDRDATAPAGTGRPLSAAELRPTWDLALGPVAGYRTERLSTASQGIEAGTYAGVTATGPRPETGSIATCLGAVSQCSKDDPTRARQRVRVAGAAGWFYAGRHVAREGLLERLYRRPWTAAREINDRQPELVLGAGPRLTLVITGTFGFRPASYDYDNATARRVMLRLARAASLRRHDTVRMPFALRGLPAPVAPEAVFLGRGQHCIGYGTGQGPYPGEWVGSVATACRVTTRNTRTATIRAADGIHEDQVAAVAVHDYPDGTSVVIEVDDNQESRLSAAQAQRLAAHADVRPSLRDPTTWIPVR